MELSLPICLVLLHIQFNCVCVIPSSFIHYHHHHHHHHHHHRGRRHHCAVWATRAPLSVTLLPLYICVRVCVCVWVCVDNSSPGNKPVCISSSSLINWLWRQFMDQPLWTESATRETFLHLLDDCRSDSRDSRRAQVSSKPNRDQ